MRILNQNVGKFPIAIYKMIKSADKILSCILHKKDAFPSQKRSHVIPDVIFSHFSFSDGQWIIMIFSLWISSFLTVDYFNSA